MFNVLNYIKDSIGNNYIGIIICKEEINQYLTIWNEHFKDDNISLLEYSKNKYNRDGDEYHITLFSVMELNAIKKHFSKEKIDAIFIDFIDDIDFKGIGKVNKNENETHYIVLTSLKLNSIRKEFGFGYKDLHITLGFNKKDIHGVDKGISTIFKSF